MVLSAAHVVITNHGILAYLIDNFKFHIEFAFTISSYLPEELGQI